MNLRQLEVFLAVVDAGGFTAAAERLRVAQPAISVTIRNLEEDLRVSLLTRIKKRVALTAEGAAFLKHARALIAQVAASRHEMAALQSLEVGHLKVGAPTRIAGFLLPSVVERYASRYPGIRISIELGGADEIAARVLQGELDVGIIADWRAPKGLAIRPLKPLPMAACVATNSPLAKQKRLSWLQVLQQPLILYPHGYYQRARVEDAATRFRRQLNIKMETASVPIILEMVRRGHGVAMLLSAALKRAPGICILALPREATVPVAICHRQGVPLVRAAELVPVV